MQRSRAGVGERNLKVEQGGVAYVPGWFLYRDADGVVVLA